MTDSKVIVSIRNLNKNFGSVAALADINIDIQAGEIFALLGPSGCGKSTLLRMISGFETPDSGELLLDDQDLSRLPPNKRPINMVFQSYAVFPHMSVQDNVAYGLKMDGVASAEREQRVKEVLAQVHLSDFAKRMPEQLSGGQRQRVALARALVKKPRVLLLDEPLSALDAKLRDAMRLELVKLQETVGITFIIVTHDQDEALAMSDRIAVLENGKVRQIASPAELYQNPCDAFVADFIGHINTFSVQHIEVSPEAAEVGIRTDRLGQFVLHRPLPQNVSHGPQAKDTGAVVAESPEHVQLSTTKPNDGRIELAGRLGDVAYQGLHSIIEIRMPDDKPVTAVVSNETASELQKLTINDPIWACWDGDDMLLLPRNAQGSGK